MVKERTIQVEGTVVDRVKVELTPYDPNRGRITWRYK
jgi:translation initiation factor IF-1